MQQKDLKQAIEHRTSRRHYLNQALDAQVVEALQREIERINREQGLSLQLILDSPDAFQHTYGVFSCVRNYIAMVGSMSDPHTAEKLGYFGEQLVLMLTAMGIGTCWVAVSYDRTRCAARVDDGQALFCVITLGPTQDQRGMLESIYHRLIRRGAKPLKKLLQSTGTQPAFLMEAARAAQLAPSAMNRQPVYFQNRDGQISAHLKTLDRMAAIDLGIAKAHFMIGAGGGSWTYGDGGVFSKGE